jgi:hypothetical protein
MESGWKPKGRENGEAGLGWLVCEIHPEQTASIPDEFGELLRRNILADRLSFRVVERTDHFTSREVMKLNL